MEKPSVVLCILIGLFGIGSWIDINGLWVETPLLVQSAPEEWSLPSYMVVIIQIANIGPLTYILCNSLSKGVVSERPVIYVILSVGFISCILLAMFWQHTVYFLGQMRSIPLLALTLCLAFVDCTSSLVFLPYMALFPQAYLTALYIGEGCSGLLPGIVALIQGIGGEAKCVNSTDSNGTIHIVPEYPSPNFSVKAFFLLLGFMLLCSFIAFLIIDCHPKMKSYRTVPEVRRQVQDSSPEHHYLSYDSSVYGSPVVHYTDSTVPMLHENAESRNEYSPTRQTCVVLFFFVAWVNALSNGFLPSIQSYASIPYGNIPYHLCVTLSNITNPAACFLTFFWKLKSTKVIGVMILVGTGIAGFLTYLAFLSPQPPLADNVGGKIIMILCWVLLTAIFSYVKTVIGLLLQSKGKKYLTWCGLFTQIGSCFGAVSSFLIVNIFKLLSQKYPCST